MERVSVYIDGFNLYFGLRSKGWQRYYWLDMELLAKNLLKPHQELAKVVYFTSRVTDPPDKHRRQLTYLEALSTRLGLRIVYGQYQTTPRWCRACGSKTLQHTEKMTDVNVAVEVLDNAFVNRFDTALLITADSDLSAPIRAVRELFPSKQVVVAFPPGRKSKELVKLANGSFIIGESKLRRSRLPEAVAWADGFLLRRPAEWS